jgi:HAD superfamily hydrolase (TIGR01509 family)
MDDECSNEGVMKYKAVLFDFDGTLCDNMADHFGAWKYAFSKHVEIQPEDYYPYEGSNLHVIASMIVQKYELEDVNLAKIAEMKDDYYLDHNEFKPYDGVEELVEYLKSNGIKIGIVTAGRMVRISQSTPKSFLTKFDCIITGDNHPGKPAPEIYIAGAKALGLKPAECIAVENSTLGVMSAKKAGMYCIGVCSTLDKKYLERADKILGSFKQIMETSVIQRLKR